MLISLFPNADIDSGLGNPSSTIKIEAVTAKWARWSDFLPPTRPQVPRDVDAISAFCLKTGLVGAAAIISTLI
jgi:hypothetical protein